MAEPSIGRDSVLDVLMLMLTGTHFPQASATLAQESSEGLARVATMVRDLEAGIDDSIRHAARHLPDQTREHYIRAMRQFTDSGGGLLRRVRDQVDAVSGGQNSQASQIFEAKAEMIAELVQLFVELVVLEMLEPFFPTWSAAQRAFRMARARVRLLLQIARLTQLAKLGVAATFEALSESITSFAAQTYMINGAPQKLRRNKYDWRNIGQAAAVGAFIGGLHRPTHEIVSGSAFMKAVTGDAKFGFELNNPWTIGTNAATEGLLESVATAAIFGGFSLVGFLGSAVSSASEHFISQGVEGLKNVLGLDKGYDPVGPRGALNHPPASTLARPATLPPLGLIATTEPADTAAIATKPATVTAQDTAAHNPVETDPPATASAGRQEATRVADRSTRLADRAIPVAAPADTGRTSSPAPSPRVLVTNALGAAAKVGSAPAADSAILSGPVRQNTGPQDRTGDAANSSKTVSLPITATGSSPAKTQTAPTTDTTRTQAPTPTAPTPQSRLGQEQRQPWAALPPMAVANSSDLNRTALPASRSEGLTNGPDRLVGCEETARAGELQPRAEAERVLTALTGNPSAVDKDISDLDTASGVGAEVLTVSALPRLPTEPENQADLEKSDGEPVAEIPALPTHRQGDTSARAHSRFDLGHVPELDAGLNDGSETGKDRSAGFNAPYPAVDVEALDKDFATDSVDAWVLWSGLKEEVGDTEAAALVAEAYRAATRSRSEMSRRVVIGDNDELRTRRLHALRTAHELHRAPDRTRAALTACTAPGNQWSGLPGGAQSTGRVWPGDSAGPSTTQETSTAAQGPVAGPSISRTTTGPAGLASSEGSARAAELKSVTTARTVFAALTGKPLTTQTVQSLQTVGDDTSDLETVSIATAMPALSAEPDNPPSESPENGPADSSTAERPGAASQTNQDQLDHGAVPAVSDTVAADPTHATQAPKAGEPAAGPWSPPIRQPVPTIVVFADSLDQNENREQRVPSTLAQRVLAALSGATLANGTTALGSTDGAGGIGANRENGSYVDTPLATSFGRRPGSSSDQLFPDESGAARTSEEAELIVPSGTPHSLVKSIPERGLPETFIVTRRDSGGSGFGFPDAVAAPLTPLDAVAQSALPRTGVETNAASGSAEAAGVVPSAVHSANLPPFRAEQPDESFHPTEQPSHHAQDTVAATPVSPSATKYAGNPESQSTLKERTDKLPTTDRAEHQADARTEAAHPPTDALGRLSSESQAPEPPTPYATAVSRALPQLGIFEYPPAVRMASEQRAVPTDLTGRDVHDLSPGLRGPLRVNRVRVHPAVQSIGIPRGDLPVGPVMAVLRTQAAAESLEVPDAFWDRLPRTLLANYRYLLASENVTYISGLPIMIVPGFEALITLRLNSPKPVPDGATLTAVEEVEEDGRGGDQDSDPSNASQAKGTEGINAVFRTGANTHTKFGSTSNFRASVGVNFGIGTGGIVATVGAGIGVATGVGIDRSTTAVMDAEGGNVEDNRVDHDLVAYKTEWQVRIRRSASISWTEAAHITCPVQDRLLVYVPRPYLMDPSLNQVVRTASLPSSFPSHYYASGLTSLPTLVDEILAALTGQGLTVELAGITYSELVQLIGRLDVHLDESTDGGYTLMIHDKRGRPIAHIVVRSELQGKPERVGAASRVAHLESVRTGIRGTGGSQTSTDATTLTFPQVDVGLHPMPLNPGFGLGFSAALAWTWASSAGNSTGRTGLWVSVPRSDSHTVAYRLAVRHRATVTAVGREATDTPWVEGTAVVRFREEDAFRLGLPIDATAVLRGEWQTVENDKATEGPALLASTAPQTLPPETKLRDMELLNAPTPLVPDHLESRRGVGMGLVEIDESVTRAVHAFIATQLREQGFLPPTEMPQNVMWWEHADLWENEALLKKFISRRGFESHYDEIHQDDGMSLKLYRYRTFLGIAVDVDEATIYIHGHKGEGDQIYFRGVADNYHVVNLSMGMDTAGQSLAGRREVSLNARLRTPYRRLQSASVGIGVRHAVGAAQSSTTFTSMPSLLESPGKVDVFDVHSTVTVSIHYQHSGLRGRIGIGRRNSPSPTFPLTARIRTPTMANDFPPIDPGCTNTPIDILESGVVSYLDTTGLREAARNAVKDLVGPQGAADEEINNFAGGTSVRAHIGAILSGTYTSDIFVDPGLFRDTYGMVDISATLRPSEFAGVTSGPFVMGQIKLGLNIGGTSHNRSTGLFWNQAEFSVGDSFNHGQSSAAKAGWSVSRNWNWNSSRGGTRTGGTERIQLSFDRAYAFRTLVDFRVQGRQEKSGKFAPASYHRPSARRVDSNRLVYLLPEPEALRRYAQGVVPIPIKQLSDVLARWAEGELKLDGDTVAGILLRWAKGNAPLPREERLETIAETNVTRGSKFSQEIRAAVETLRVRHCNGTLPVRDSRIRRDFLAEFAAELDPPVPVQVRLPEYLLRRDRGGNVLGHSGITTLRYDQPVSGERTSTLELVKSQLRKAAPGLITADVVAWGADGRQIGRLQGGIDALQSLFAQGRDQVLLDDMLAEGGIVLSFTNPIGWNLGDHVRVRIWAEFVGNAKIGELVENSGIETYTHGYTQQSQSHSIASGQSVNLGQVTVGGLHAGGSGGLAFSQGEAQAVSRTHDNTVERTAYTWNGYYPVEIRQRIHVEVDRVDARPSSLRAMATALYRRAAGLSFPAPLHVEAMATLILQVPKGLAEIAPNPPNPGRVRSLRKIPALPHDAYFVGALLDDIKPVANRLLVEVFGREADHLGPLQVLLSRSQLIGHMHEAVGGKSYLVAEDLFAPGSSPNRAAVWLTGDLYDLQTLGVIEGSGTGRYAKESHATSMFHGANRLRPSVNVNLTGSGTLNEYTPHPASSMNPGSGLSRSTSAGETDAGGRSFRHEQHAKQQGRLHLVRMRGKFWLEATKYREHWLPLERTTGRHFRSSPVTGDVYAEIPEDELYEMIDRGAPNDAQLPAHAWRHLDASQEHLELLPLLEETLSAAGFEPDQLHLLLARKLARRLARRPGALVSLALTLDVGQALANSYRAWRDRGLALQSTIADRLPPGCDAVTVDLHEELSAMVSSLPGFASAAPDAFSLVSGRAQWELLARDLAHELHAAIRLDINIPPPMDSRMPRGRRLWAEPCGRVHYIHPLQISGLNDFDLDMAYQLGALDANTVRKARAAGLEKDELVRLYANSWKRDKSLDAEILERLSP
ncbi:hypothetical protein [Streptomyces sp. TLI_171]|uniref:hypothetical protein n=1 Tax=Streptomyces sp. TLI_171 TaxID=1938859 RepID=UPI000C4DB305|nr:hypothetical protein [Streptomyces sp. TLI_171]RKE22087.1 hypothetical protein BX266_5509 [Streptomyces sp. TLI_171]